MSVRVEYLVPKQIHLVQKEDLGREEELYITEIRMGGEG